MKRLVKHRSSVLTFAVSAVFLANCLAAQAQQSAKTPRVGFLSTGSPSNVPARLQAFRSGLRELGYVHGKNIMIEERYADGKVDRLTALAEELVHLKVDVIVTSGPSPTRAVKKTTAAIPIVMTWDYDPVGNGLVASLAQPGGNVTGLSTMAPEISGKQLELLKEIIPKLSRVAILGTANVPGNAEALRATEVAAEALKVQLQYLETREGNDIATGFQAARKGRADAMLALPSRVLFFHRTQVADLAVKNRLPVIYGESEHVEAGGLMTYGVSIVALFRRSANYVDKILKGAKPAYLPVEQPSKFELVINLKTAKQIGLTIPPHVLARADRVIK